MAKHLSREGDNRVRRARRKAWKRVVSLLCCVTVFCTVYALMLPAITLSEKTNCSLEEHRHGDDCFETQLACGFDGTGHIHDESCIGSQTLLICEEDHEHTEDCYEVRQVLTCELPESEADGEVHEHTDECYEKILICTLEEHTHSDACFAEPESDLETAMLEIYGRVTAFGTEEADIGTLCLDAYTQLCDVLDSACEAFDSGFLTQEELTALENLFDEIVAYMRDEYGFDPYGTAETASAAAPLAITAEEGEYVAVEGAIDLTMYHCDYAPGATLSNGGLLNNQYVARQIKPADVGMEKGTNDNRFKIEGAYIGSDEEGRECYLIPLSYLQTGFAGYGYSFDEGYCPFYCTPENFVISDNNRIHAEYVSLDGNRYVRVSKLTGASGNVGAVFFLVLEREYGTISPASSVISLFDYWTTENRFDPDDHPSAAEMNSGINKDHALKFGKSIPDTYGDMNHSLGGTEQAHTITTGIVKPLLGEDGYPVFTGTTTTNYSSDSSLVEAGLLKEASFNYLFDPSIDVEGKASFPRVTGLLMQDEQGYYTYEAKENYAEFNEATNSFELYKSPGVYSKIGGSDRTYGQFFPFNDFEESVVSNCEETGMNHYFGLTVTSRFMQDYGGYTTSGRDTEMVFRFSGDNDVWIFIDGVLVADMGGLRSYATVEINFHTGKVTYGEFNSGLDTTIHDMFTAAGRTDVVWQDNGNGYYTFEDGTLHTLKFFYLERGNFDSNLKLTYNLNQVPPSGIYKIDQYGDVIDGARFAVYKATEDYHYIGTDGMAYTSDEVKSFTVDSRTGNIKNESGVTVITPAYCDSTQSGEMVFKDADGMPLSMDEVAERFGERFILREIDVPEGYRTVSDEIYLRRTGDVLVCDNTYKSGVWASSNAMVTATNTLYVAREYAAVADKIDADNPGVMFETFEVDGVTYRSVNYYNAEGNVRNGTLFAVVLKRNGRDFWHGYGYDYWFPVYGTDTEGFSVVTDGVPDEPTDWSTVSFDTAGTNAAAAITAAREQVALAGGKETGVVFEETGSGMQVTMKNLPGKIERYYTWMNDNGKLVNPDGSALTPEQREALDAQGDPQYVVAYYWTSGTLAEATADNTVRVYSHSNLVQGVNSELRIQWGSSINIPNIENRLFFQKMDEGGELVNGANFALYDVYEAMPADKTENQGFKYIYYIGSNAETGGKVYVAPLDNSEAHPSPGRAAVFGVDADGTGQESVRVIGYGDYKISGTTGVISVKLTDPVASAPEQPGTEFLVRPAKNADGLALVGNTHDVCPVVSEPGTGHFTMLKEGRYYLREISAPAGYSVNGAEIPVLVNSNGVYAYAGTSAADGVDVGNGIGYLVRTLNVFASQGQIDETLAWVYAALIRHPAEDFSSFDKVSGDVIHVTENGELTGWQFVKRNPELTAGYGSDFSNTRSDAMVTYLQFAEGLAEIKDQELIFDYLATDTQAARTDAEAYPYIGEDGYRTLEGEGTIRLFVRTGWSDLAIYQDYGYGHNQTSTGLYTNYDDLTAYGNISNLFSSSTFVRVTDEPSVDLTVLKVDAMRKTTRLEGAQFRVSRVETDADGTETRKYYRLDYGFTGTLEQASALTTDSGGVLTLTDLADGKYCLEELKAPIGYNPIEAPVYFTVSEKAVSVDGRGAAASVTLEDTTQAGDPGITYRLTVPNGSTYELPDTGGVGTEPYLVSGFILLAAGAALIILNNLHGAGKNNQTKRSVHNENR